ncbi:hypothetical protein [Salipiger mucosus]|uniref:Uncharacterized protein n=1 Tax=Salipiger mucosus DSM 16094 TaxID=1123237 RepID=S9R104_9RHOB|nr:hypothetical protein [Salipiger mucosus]EPX85567.1 hypothetical protein Salmuc_04838 [Salipiger mucosus DSM 16094]
MSEPEELMRAGATLPRRVIGTGTMAGLGLLLLWLVIDKPPEAVIWQVFLIVFGAGALWLAQIMWRATGRQLILTDAALEDSSGAVLVRVENVEKVDRSMFAMKPSNGFLVLLKEPQPRAWQPGLWWRSGRRVAIGGVTAARDTKPMADALSMLVMRHRGELPDMSDLMGTADDETPKDDTRKEEAPGDGAPKDDGHADDSSGDGGRKD